VDQRCAALSIFSDVSTSKASCLTSLDRKGRIVLKNTGFGKIGEIFVRTAQPAF